MNHQVVNFLTSVKPFDTFEREILLKKTKYLGLEVHFLVF